MGNPYGMKQNIVPLIAPVDTAATAIASPFVALQSAHALRFLLFFGVITAASADQSVTVTVEAATTGATGSEAAIAFNYRKSDAVGANVWGAITAATSAGLAIATTDDGKAVLIEVDPAAVQTAKEDATHVRVVITPDGGGTVTLVTALAEIDPRYMGSTMESAT